MASPPPSTQPAVAQTPGSSPLILSQTQVLHPDPEPLEYHPDFGREVFTVVFKIEDKVKGTWQGFKIDAMRLTAHAKFLRDMFFDSGGHLGEEDEGSERHPIIIDWCTQSAFANFCGWLNHNSWSPHCAVHAQQLLDILHISHMWDVRPGVQFASQELLLFKLSSPMRLQLAGRYNLTDWVEMPVRVLVNQPLSTYTQKDQDLLGLEFYAVIATTRELIAAERSRLGNFPPLPKNFEDAPFCAPGQHAVCQRVWAEKWFFIILRRIHHTTKPLALTQVPDALREIDHKGMNPDCKAHIIDWLCDSCEHLDNEEKLIREAVVKISGLVGL